MAYMNQEKKKVIHEALKKVIPKSWKWTLRVQHHSSIYLTIHSAPVELIKSNAMARDHDKGISINRYYLDRQYSGDLLKTFQDISKAMQAAGWYDRSDAMVDYFDTGYYINIEIGRWNKPFIVK